MDPGGGGRRGAGRFGAGLTAVSGGEAGLFAAGSKGGEGGGVSGNTMGVGEVLGLSGGEGSGLSGESGRMVFPLGGDTHLGLEVGE